MPKKEYSLLSTEGLTDFDNDMLRAMQEIADSGFNPRASVLIAVDNEGNVGTFYHNANLSDMILMKGFLDLDIHTDYLTANSMELPEDYAEDEEGDESQC